MATELYKNVYKNQFFKQCLNSKVWKEKYIDDINRLATKWNDVANEYGKLVRAARESLNMSRKSFSEELGITISQITNIESGKFNDFITFYETVDNNITGKNVVKCFVTYPECFIKVREYLFNNGLYTVETFRDLTNLSENTLYEDIFNTKYEEYIVLNNLKKHKAKIEELQKEIDSCKESIDELEKRLYKNRQVQKALYKLFR